jgi:hypothetical protein
MQPPLDLLRRVDDNHLMGVPFGRLGWQSPSDLTFWECLFCGAAAALYYLVLIRVGVAAGSPPTR